ncbi:MAG: hypothetical protein CMK09_15565 [Ponticaulis sp.]|nr:hypothetical protein [Ponticaulis sp.]|tara:strand:- start:1524 stop:2036 length:513 start_codon:yes stop_codon:yes gene_type:complete
MAVPKWIAEFKFPAYNADIARFLTVFFLTFAVILLTSSEAPINRMVQEYYKVPVEMTELAMMQLSSNMLFFGSVAGLSWALHIMLRNIGWKAARLPLNIINVAIHYFALLMFGMTLFSIFVDMNGQSSLNSCEHPLLPNCATRWETLNEMNQTSMLDLPDSNASLVNKQS